jgi:hypothetical protein
MVRSSRWTRIFQGDEWSALRSTHVSYSQHLPVRREGKSAHDAACLPQDTHLLERLAVPLVQTHLLVLKEHVDGDVRIRVLRMGTDLSADGDDVLVRGDRAGRKARGQLEHLLIIPDRLDPPELGYEHRPVVAPCDRLGLCAPAPLRPHHCQSAPSHPRAVIT